LVTTRVRFFWGLFQSGIVVCYSSKRNNGLFFLVILFVLLCRHSLDIVNTPSKHADMSIHQFHAAPASTPLVTTLTAGEMRMPHAPSVELPNGKSCIPQHYLRYQQTAESIAEIVVDIDFDAHTPIFASADHSGMYLQVGLVGRENYDRSHQLRPQKLVYGRKWRIDTDTPTSEIIQTAFLAIKKAREHEVRELLTQRDPISGKTSTPFSSHLDLPLMALNLDLVGKAETHAPAPSAERIAEFLAPVRFGQRVIEVLDVLPRPNGTLLVDLQLGELPLARQAEGDLSEFNHLSFTVLLRELSQSELLHEIMAAMVLHSDRLVDERFTYKGFARFSRVHAPARIAQLSIATRPYARDAANASFTPVFKAMNYEVDAARAPALGSGALASKNRSKIAAFGPQLAGHMPPGYRPAQFVHALSHKQHLEMPTLYKTRGSWSAQASLLPTL
jgi:hypothetical protein